MEPSIKLSIIIVNYKTKELTAHAVESLLQFCPWVKNQQVIIVDNASHDGSFDFLKNKFPWAHVIENKENTGFAGGNNIGLKEAKGKYMLLLNSDTVSIEDPLTTILDFMEKDSSVAISSIQLLNEDKSIQSTGGYFLTLARLFFWMFFIDDLPIVRSLIKSYHPDASRFNKAKKFYTKAQSLDWLTGAFFLMRREVYDAIDGFDEAMFMYAEEMEFCYRAKKAGFSCKFVPVAKIVHLGGKSSGSIKNSLLGEYKNILYFYKKHYSTLEQQIARQLLKCGALLRSFIFPVVGKKEVGQIYAQAYRSM